MPTDASLDAGDKLRQLGSGLGSKPPGRDTPAGRPAGEPDPMKKTLKQIGVLITARSQARFRTQEFGGVKWTERAVPNVAGAIKDLTRASAPKQRRIVPPGRPANVDTGQLRNSIDHRTTADNIVEVGSNLVYAGEAQEGGPFSLPIPQTVKDKIRVAADKGIDWGLALEFLADPDLQSFESERPERIFVGMDEKDRGDILKIIEANFGGEATFV